MRSAALLGLVMALLPAASVAGAQVPPAGKPHFEDPSDDQVPSLELTRHLDLLAGWFHDLTAEEFQVSLKVATYQEGAAASYRFTWYSMHPDYAHEEDPYNYSGVQVDFGPSGTDWWLLKGHERGGGLEYESVPVRGEIRAGDPAYATWWVPRDQVLAKLGTVLRVHGVVARSAPDGPTQDSWPRPLLGAPQFIVFRPEELQDPTFAAPARPADLTDAPNDVDRPGNDLQRVWLEFGETHADFVLELGLFRWTDVGECTHWSWNLALGGPDWDHLWQFGFSTSHDAGEMLAWYENGQFGRHPVPARLNVLEGEPGYVRARIDRAQWNATTDPNALGPSIRVECSTEQRNHLDMFPEFDGGGVPGPPVLAVVGVALLALRARRRRNL